MPVPKLPGFGGGKFKGPHVGSSVTATCGEKRGRDVGTIVALRFRARRGYETKNSGALYQRPGNITLRYVYLYKNVRSLRRVSSAYGERGPLTVTLASA